jgi:hypothetical protein
MTWQPDERRLAHHARRWMLGASSCPESDLVPFEALARSSGVIVRGTQDQRRIGAVGLDGLVRPGVARQRAPEGAAER